MNRHGKTRLFILIDFLARKHKFRFLLNLKNEDIYVQDFRFWDEITLNRVKIKIKLSVTQRYNFLSSCDSLYPSPELLRRAHLSENNGLLDVSPSFQSIYSGLTKVRFTR